MKISVILFVILFSFFQLNAQWVSQTSGVSESLYSISAVDNNTCWISGTGGVILRTTNGGTRWSNVGGGSVIDATKMVSTIFALDANFCLATASTAAATFVYKTTNGGTSWAQVFTQAAGFIDGIWMTSATNGFMVGDPVHSRWSLWKTTDGGTTWDSTGLKLAQVGTEYGNYNVLYINGEQIWFGTNNTKIYYSPDNGATWVAQATPGQTLSCSVWFNGNVGFSNGRSTLSRTTDAGSHWGLVTRFPFPVFLSGPVGQGSQWVCSTLDGSIYYSNDNGISFSRVDSVAGNNYSEIGIAREGNTVWVTAGKGQIRKGVINYTGIAGEVTVIPKAFSLEQNYPNPFNPETKIKFSLPVTTQIKLTIYSELGERVAELLNGTMEAGYHEVSFNAMKLSSGIYFYRIQAGSFIDTKKMILLK